MTERITQIARTLKRVGEIQVNDWDFMALLQKDIADLEPARALRRLGNVRVTEWDFRNPLPAVAKLANTEVDVLGFMKRTASYKVLDWDFRSPPANPAAPPAAGPTHAEMAALTDSLRNFLNFVAANLVGEPGHARLRVEEIGENTLRCRLVLVRRDVAPLIGRNGETAAAIRGLLKAAAARHGVHALLEIVSHEDDAR
jgi:predicted RNA-binding protein YlqC (UPF0109 family)